MKRHVEGLDQPERLGADVADTERAEGPADEADAHVLAPRRKARRALRASLSFTISLPVRASMKVTIETATGRRTPSGVMTSAMSLAVQAGTSTVS